MRGIHRQTALRAANSSGHAVAICASEGSNKLLVLMKFPEPRDATDRADDECGAGKGCRRQESHQRKEAFGVTVDDSRTAVRSPHLTPHSPRRSFFPANPFNVHKIRLTGPTSDGQVDG